MVQGADIRHRQAHTTDTREPRIMSPPTNGSKEKQNPASLLSVPTTDETILDILSRHGVPVHTVDRTVWKDRYGERSARLDHLNRNLLDFKRVMDSHQVRFLLGQGTLLAAVRDGDFFPHSVDCDLYVYWDDREQFAIAAKELVALDFLAVKLYRKQGLKKISFERNEEIIDVKFLELDSRWPLRRWKAGIHRYPFRFFERNEAVPFLGETFLVPAHFPRYLKRSYGPGWRSTVLKLQAPEWFSRIKDSLVEQDLLVSVEYPFWPLRILKFRTLRITCIDEMAEPSGMVMFAAGDKLCLRYVVESGPDNKVRVLSGSRRNTAKWWPRSQVLAQVTELRLRKSNLAITFHGVLARSLLRVVSRLFR
jgi:hypothetical protein